MGWMATAAGMIGYMATMQGFGFTPMGLIGLNNLKGYNPEVNGVAAPYDPTSPVLGNTNI